MNGNPQKEDGFTPIANEIVEALARVNLTAHEWRVLWCVLRKTYGYNKKEDWLSGTQLCAMTGLHKAHVSRAKKLLAVRNMVTPRGNKIGFNKFYSTWSELPHGVNDHSGKKVTPRGTLVTPRGNSELPHGADTKDNITKDTIQKTPSSTKKGPNAAVAAVMSAMRETYGDLDDSEANNRRYCWLLVQRALKGSPAGGEAAAAAAVVTLLRAAKDHPFWGGKITKVEHLYRSAHRIANDLRENRKPKVRIIS